MVFRKNLPVVLALVMVCGFGLATLGQAEEMRVRDIPIPEGATDITYMKRRGDVRFQVTSDFKATGAFYAKKLGEQRWTKSGKDNLQADFWVQTFSKDDQTLEVRVDSQAGGSEVRLTPKGLMWDEDDQPTPKEVPLPTDATDVEYDDFAESIEFKSPSDMKTVVEFLSKELTARKWTKADTEFDLATFVRMKFTQNKSTLEIDVRGEDSGSEVAIRTKGMQWDGMAAEIERATNESSDDDADAPSQNETADMPLTLPKRQDKPKQGIDKLSKLPNEGSVAIDGKDFQLTSVVAYEVYADDRWGTKIVATQKPVNERSLLERLKKTGTDEDADGSRITWPQPHLVVTLDEEDRPERFELLAEDTPGGGSGSELEGTALVEDGRARGTFKLKEPGSFIDKVYTAEISFDVPVLTRDSTPTKRLANVPRLTNSGTLTIGDKTYQLPNVVTYEMKESDKPVTAVVLSEKPLNLAKLKAALGKKSIENYFEFIPQVKLIVDANDQVTSMAIWADNFSMNSNQNLSGDVVIEDGRARGTAKMTEPGDFFDKKYTFDVSFDVDVLGRPATPAQAADSSAAGLVADSYDGWPIPEGYQSIQKEGSKFRTKVDATVPAELNAVVEFYRRELAADEWKENKALAKIEKASAALTFTRPSGGLMVQLKSTGDETAITLISRDAQAAKAAGLLPSTGKGRLLIGNADEGPATITVNKRDYALAAGAGADDPKKGLNWEVAPGKYTVEVKLKGRGGHAEKLTIGAGEIWGLMVLPEGESLVFQLY